MQSLAKHRLELVLDDKTWFRFVSLKDISSLHKNSVTHIKSMPALGVLSGGVEFTFAFLVYGLALSSLLLQNSLAPHLALLVCFIGFLVIFITKRVLIYKKFGFGTKWMMTVSNEFLEINPLARKDKIGSTLTLSKDEITDITFNYTLDKKYVRNKGERVLKKSASLHACEISLKNGDVIALDVMRIGFFDLLYLLVFHQYPLTYRNTVAGGASGIAIILVRLTSLAAIGCALVMLAFNLK